MHSKRLTIIQVNDVHGYIKSHQEVFFTKDGLKIGEAGGYARIKTIINQAKADCENTIVLDCGDTFHGTFITTQTEGNAIIPLLNKMGFTAMTAHWDFAYTPSKLRDLTYRLNYPMLGANVYLYDKAKRVFDPYVIKDISGLKIGIFGMACEHVVQGFPKKFSQGIYMSPEYQEIPIVAKELRNKHHCDLVIMLSHLGMPTDYEILSKTEGIDICISGHTHNRLNSPIMAGNTLLIQSGCHGSFVGKLDLVISNGKVISYNHELIPLTTDIKEDKEILATVNEIYEPYIENLSEVVGKTNTLLCRDLASESTMDNFLLHAISNATGREICFSHGWRYGAPINIGDISLEDLYNITPMNPEIINVDMRGYEIVEMLETFIEHTYSRNPFGQVGGYLPRAIGIKVYLKIENPKGHRIQEIFIQGEKLDASKTYLVSYITDQGVPAYLGENRVNTKIKAVDAMKDYLSKYEAVNEEYLNTFTII